MEVDLQVVVLSGPGDVQRAVFGLSSALAAQASGVQTTVVFSMHGAHWASPTTGYEHAVPEFPPIAELLANLQEVGGRIEGCSTCLENYCPSLVGEDGLKELREGVVRVGLGLVAIRMASVRTIVT